MPTRFDLRLLWIVCLLVAPVVLILIELFHPAGFTKVPGMFEYLREAQPNSQSHKALDYFGPNWWFWLHSIQTPMVCLVAIGLVLSASDFATRSDGTLIFGDIDCQRRLRGPLAWAAAAGLFIFSVFYTVLDAIGGIGLGRTLVLVNELQASGQLDLPQITGIALLLDTVWTDPLVGGVGSVISKTGSWAIFIATLLLAVLGALAPSPSPAAMVQRLVALAALIAGGWAVQESHACCTGPVGFALILVFGLLTLWSDRHRTSEGGQT